MIRLRPTQMVIKEPTRTIIISINILTITTTTTTRTVIIMVTVTAMAIMDGVDEIPSIIYMIKLYTFIIEIMFVKINFKKKNLVLSDLN